MKHDKYCEVCGCKVARLWHITLHKYVFTDYEVCSECIDAIQNYINKRLTR